MSEGPYSPHGCRSISLSMPPPGVAIRSHIAGITPLNDARDSTLHHPSHPTDASLKGTLSRRLQVFDWEGLTNRLSIEGQSDLDAQATQLK
eukprot:204909-Pyramimonas_sp.AAC.1